MHPGPSPRWGTAADARRRMSERRVTVTGATGLLGPRLVKELQAGGWQVTVLSRNPDRAKVKLPGVEAHAWDLMSDPAPVAALEGREAVVHLAGEPVAQRWSDSAKRAIRESRVVGTEHLLEGLRGTSERARGADQLLGDGLLRPARPRAA